MCLCPITLHAPSDWNSLKHRVARLYNPDHYKRLYSDVVSVPCGKCIECVKAHQNDMLQVFWLAAMKYKTMHFVTLTYCNETLPFSYREYLGFGESEEPRLSPPVIERSALSSVLANDYFRQHSPSEKWLPRVCEYDGCTYTVCPSVCRRDVRLWLKRAREDWKYHHDGEQLPDFKYSMVPEYGSKTHRPHYHLLFFGLSDYHLNIMCEDWRQRFGFVRIDSIPLLSNGNDGQKVASYVSKYVNKGCFESPILHRGSDGFADVERPRICSSAGLVCPSDSMVDYWLCKDLEGRPSFDYAPHEDRMKRYLDRRRFRIGDFDYRLGKHLVDFLSKSIVYNVTLGNVFSIPPFRPIYDEQGRLLEVTDAGKKFQHSSKASRDSTGEVVSLSYIVKSKTLRTSLQKELTEFLYRVHNVRVHHELEELQRQFPSETAVQIAERYFAVNELDEQTRKEVAVQSLKRFYQRSKF